MKQRQRTGILYVAAAVGGLTSLIATPAVAAPHVAGAAQIFAEAEVICQRDGGALWGRSLCGPIMLVDYTHRTVVTNRQDSERTLKAAGSVFTGVLPEAVIIANTPTEWSGTRWTQLVVPLQLTPPSGTFCLLTSCFIASSRT